MTSSHDILITCRRCGNKSPVGDMKYDLNGKDLICGRCYEIKVAVKKRPETAGQYAETEKFKLEFTDPLEGKKEVSYFCPKCKFRFKRKKEHGIPKTCPYCNRPDLIVEGSTSAEKLIKDSSSKEYYY
jgi:DNA-directed RNA polymerase subunit RPC12/RpoP